MLEAAIAFVTLLYAALAAAAARAADRARAPAAKATSPLPFVSVLVAARNEERTLAACLNALREQSYPDDRYEVVVADDHSSDATQEIARRHGAQCVQVAADRGGKADALHTAYVAARGELLLVTDADCRPPRDWIRNMVGAFDGKEGVVCGVTSVKGTTLLARVQALDWTLLLTVAAGFSEMGIPVTAMGNNMAFRRRAYEEVGGYPALPATVTEDYALFRAVDRRTGHTVRLLLDERLENFTEPLPTLRKIVGQRRRWVRGGLRTDVWVYVVFLLIFGTHLLLAAGLVLAPLVALPAIAVKIGADAYVLATGTRHLSLPRRWTDLPLFELYFFGYIVALPILLLAAPRIVWRGRRY